MVGLLHRFQATDIDEVFIRLQAKRRKHAGIEVAVDWVDKMAGIDKVSISKKRRTCRWRAIGQGEIQIILICSGDQVGTSEDESFDDLFDIAPTGQALLDRTPRSLINFVVVCAYSNDQRNAGQPL